MISAQPVSEAPKVDGDHTRQRVEEMQLLLERVQRDNTRIATIVIELREAAERIEELSAYYLGDDWPEDRERMREMNGTETPAVLSEDVTWRAIADNETGIRHLVYTCAHQLVNQANGKLGDLVADAVRAAD